MTKAENDNSRMLWVLNYAGQIKNISKTCLCFGIVHQTFYEWKNRPMPKMGNRS